ncbi:LPXTG cell wall anchor domain-containing protein [Glycomyces paridis]|nr:LPXTG cell wall anchor domain-containing protein [Glycomyces paridis]
MSTLKTNVLRGVAATGVAAGIVAASSGAAFAQDTIVAEALIYIPSAVVVGSNPLELTITPTTSDEVTGSVVTITPDDRAVLDFNPIGADCADGADGSLVCTVPGVLPADGVLLELDAVVADTATAESDLGFGLLFEADDVSPATMHTGLALGSTDLVDNEAPEEPATEEPTEEPTAGEEQPSEENPTGEESSAQSTLPTTGGNAGLMIAAAAAVAVAGAGALVFARRRKAAASWE